MKSISKGLLFSVLVYLAFILVRVHSVNTDQVDYNKYEMDSLIKDIMWCGSNNEAILVLSDKGTVYRSRDRGVSWKKLQAQLGKAGQSVADQGQEIGQVSSIMQSPVDDNLVVFIGTHGINWVTDDCGLNVRGLNSGKKIHEFQFHPTERTWALAATWTDCTDFGDDPCKIYKELYVTKDLGGGWQFLKEYVYDFSWGYTNAAKNLGVKKLPKQRILVTHDPTAQGHQNQKKAWSPVVSLYYSDDFFETKKLILTGGNSLIKTENYIFAAKAAKGQMVQIYVSTLLSGFLNFEQTKLPIDAVLSKSFTVMDTSEQTVFLHIQHGGYKAPMGDVFVSDGSGKFYALSIDGVLRGTEFVDFEKINSLEGVFITNKFDLEKQHIIQKAKAIGSDSHKSHNFNEQEMDEEKIEKMKMSQNMDNNLSKKQQKTRQSIQKTGEEIEVKDLENNIKTYMSHNKGGKWELIKAPLYDAAGEPYKKCYVEEGCSLHLHIYSSNGIFPPPYSQETATGLIMGVGNLGKQLNRFKPDQVNTYLSRDGGMSFTEVKKGSHIYEFGDHGGLIVMAKNLEATKEVVYSWNEGKTWHSQPISEIPLDVTNIIIEPNSIAQEFIVYGQHYVPDDPDPKGVVITMDFKDLHEPQCKGVDRPGDSDSDYEIWTPYDGRHGENNKCFLGQQISYIRRKQDSECFNGEEFERQVFRHFCECTEMDYECDVNYIRTEQGTCQKIDMQEEKKGELTLDQIDQCDTFGYYTVTQGYRKIPGDKCVAGLDLNPVVYSCSYSRAIFGFLSLKGLLTLVILGAVFYFGWPLIEALLIALPIPDPKDLKEKVKNAFSSAAKSAKNATSKPIKPQGKAAGYQEGFNDAPESLEEEEDDDDDDVGKPINLNKNKLNYDSDEEKNHGSELISLDRDRTSTAAEKVPKLSKPQ